MQQATDEAATSITSARLSKIGVGLLEHGPREESQFGKERIGPTVMVGERVPSPALLLLLAQQRAQLAPHEAVHAVEGPWMRVLEVAVPACLEGIVSLTDGDLLRP